MTRYARAKGSKASNERTPNDATPWYLMKQQLIENTSKEEKSFKETKTVKELLENTQNTSNNVENVHDSWAEFPSNFEKDNFKTKKIKKKRKIINEVDNSISTVKNKEYQKDEYQSNDTSDIKKRKKDKHISEIMENNTDAIISVNESQNKKDKLSKRQKRNMKKRNSNESISKIIENNNHDSTASKNINNNKNKSKRIDQPQRKFDKNFPIKPQNFKSVPNKFGMKKLDSQKRKRKPLKIRDDKEHKRRKADLGPSKIIINGVELDIVKFDGFPVRKEDADRLSDLKQKMIMKGIPREEINTAMKLERRKAEKALARIRKCVCFHCQQGGTGICFKCGSTEHTHFECKVAKPMEFRYATCFICREQGHIAKQCPDNPKGVYPQGGACKICGDVTHLKKDCPDLIKEKEENAVTVNTITNGNLESLEENVNNIDKKDNKKTKKIVKF
ncbi:Zinc finger CCHC domain-containing protein 9 [Melipona quadrifasciata]|uniref:Zinc finger CCHC domain-containing protein 9 n=1 Tax=Melipona quadrifasciata TaxID=166423 RepID=A0A0M8ZZU9_9HYME|nr:Zinc finger CCHC domain-containing protein 9 [Melipona quadrifasciata]